MWHGLHNWECIHEIFLFCLSRIFGYIFLFLEYSSNIPLLLVHFCYLCWLCSPITRASAVVVPWGDTHHWCLATATGEDDLWLDLSWLDTKRKNKTEYLRNICGIFLFADFLFISYTYAAYALLSCVLRPWLCHGGIPTTGAQQLPLVKMIFWLDLTWLDTKRKNKKGIFAEYSKVAAPKWLTTSTYLHTILNKLRLTYHGFMHPSLTWVHASHYILSHMVSTHKKSALPSGLFSRPKYPFCQ